MKSISLSIPGRMQAGLIAAGYAGVLVVAASWLYWDHVWELNNPVDASGGMHGFGDLLAGMFLACLFMVPTIFLIWAIRKFELSYTVYSRFLLGLSLSAPVSLGVFLLGESVPRSLGFLCLYRLMGSPFVLAGTVLSRFVARFDRPKRLVSYAILVESLTIGTAVGLFIYAVATTKH